MPWGLLGAEEPLGLLSALLKAGRLPHALLFAGPEGGGKTTLARALAAALNCAAPEADGSPCGLCPSCLKIARDCHPDLGVFGPGGASRRIALADILELRRQMAFRPFEGRTKVFILREADRLGQEAGQALLKTLEEPPPDSALFLTTTAEGEVMATVRSRCLAVRLKPLGAESILRVLAERRGLSGPPARLAAALAGGALGPALAGEPEAAWAAWLSLNAVLEAENPAAGLALAWPWIARIAADRAGWPAALDLLRLWRRETLRLAVLGPEGLEVQPPQPAQSLWAPSLSPRKVERLDQALARLADSLERVLKPELALADYWLAVFQALHDGDGARLARRAVT